MSKNTEKQSKHSIFTRETFGVVLALFTTLALVCLITREKVFFTPGLVINAFLLGMFGWFSYLVLGYLLFFSITLIFGKKPNVSKKTVVLLSILALLVALLCHTIFLGNAENYVNYGEYLSKSYRLGEDGLLTSSPGGLIIALLAYPLSLLLSVVGACVIFGLAICYVGFLLIKGKINSKSSKQQKPQFRGNYVRQEQTPVPPVEVSGERDYPIPNAVPKEETQRRLFVNNPEDFAFKSKKELSKPNDNQIKMGSSSSGMGVASFGQSYSEGYSNEMQRKIEYIKKPSPIDIERAKTPVQDTYGGPKISNLIKKSQNPDYDFDIKKELQDNQNLNDEEIKNIEDDSAKRDAENFENKYLNVEEVDGGTSPIGQTESFIPRAEPVKLTENNDQEPITENSLFDQTDGTLHDTEIKPEEIKEATPVISQDADRELFTEEPKRDRRASLFEEDAPSPSVLGDRRTREILFGDQEEPQEEQKREEPKEDLGFTSRVQIDGNQPQRTFPSFGNVNSNRGDTVSRYEVPTPVSQQDSSYEQEKPAKKIPPVNRVYNRPPLDLLATVTPPAVDKQENHEERISRIKNMLEDFHISVEPVGYIQGPSITRYEFKMPAGISVKKVIGYDDDLKMCLLSKNDVRIEAPIPGKDAIGIEVANNYKTPVGLRDILEESAKEKSKKGQLIFALGKDIVGKAITDDLAECKHFLVAGSTGSGKSVAMNVMLISLLMRYSPEELRLILIDPKGVEFRPYEHIPHLMVDEIISEPKKALAVFQWAYDEMERRYKMFQEYNGVVDIDGYNEVIDSKTPKMPRIAIFVDELSNLMETCKKEMDARILSIAQKSRAAGIHLVLATQRPSVDVITGTIKANLPSRIALKLMTFADSNTIISEGGAEKLLGYGDMLYRNSGMSSCERYQGAFISRKEVNDIVNYIKENNEAYFDDECQEFLDKAVKPKQEEHSYSGGEQTGGDENNDLFKRALWLSVNSGQVAISQLQRRFQIGYARAGGLVDKMEQMGFVSGNEGSKARRVLLTVEEFLERYGPVDEGF